MAKGVQPKPGGAGLMWLAGLALGAVVGALSGWLLAS